MATRGRHVIRDTLARVVGSLLDNAEKYGREAEDRTIGLAARDAGDHVEVLVTDQGPGVAPAARGKLFRAFTRGVSSDGPAGLDLALSQSLALGALTLSPRLRELA